MDSEDFNRWDVRGNLDLDGSALGVVGTEVGGEREEPGFGVLWGEEGRERNEEEGGERD